MWEKDFDVKAISEIRTRSTVYFGCGAIQKIDAIAADLKNKGIDKVIVMSGRNAYKVTGAWDYVQKALEANNIGYINDFVLGLFIGYALIDKEYKVLQEYYENMSPRFIDKVILSMSACEEADRECACSRLEEQCHNLTSNLKLLAEIKLLHETRSVFSETYLEGVIIPCVNFVAPSQFSKCCFVNCDFSNSRIDFSIFSSCTFINCKFNQVHIQGETGGVYFFDCAKDGVSFDPNFKEEAIEEGFEPASTCSIERKILQKYFPKGSKRRKMQYISRLKNDFEDNRQFKKTFNSLVTQGYILTNGDQSHISDAGIDYLNLL